MLKLIFVWRRAFMYACVHAVPLRVRACAAMRAFATAQRAPATAAAASTDDRHAAPSGRACPKSPARRDAPAPRKLHPLPSSPSSLFGPNPQ